MATTTKKSRPMHFAKDYSGETLCGKSSVHTRTTHRLSTWDDGRLADGRRCPSCAAGVEAYRAKQAAKAVAP